MDREFFDHYLSDGSLLGPPAAGAHTGAAGGAACGDLSRLSLRLSEGKIADVSFDAEGCAAARAASAAAASLVEGAPLFDAARIGPAEIEGALGGLTPAQRHAAGLAADALHRALAALAASDEPLAAPGRGRVLVAMSGGVDSAAAALLESERGAEVVAVTLKLWADPVTDGAKACCSPQAVVSARDLAHSMGLPHFTLDLEDQFRAQVVNRFVSGYAAGTTPNPCVLCNGEVRIAAMVALADRLGAERLATGHYARLVDDGEGPLLAPATDAAKDQTYMLAGLDPSLLGRLSFPLAGLTKPEVRERARRAGLGVAEKRESQDLCFLAGEGKGAFLRRHGRLRDREGEIVDRRGRRLGRHRGHHHFTMGQRRGLGLTSPEPLYVLGTDAAANRVVVGSRAELAVQTVAIEDAVLHRPGARVDAVKLRYHSAPVPASVSGDPGRHEQLHVELGEAVLGAAPGQTAVLLSEGAIVGHGTIAAGSA